MSKTGSKTGHSNLLFVRVDKHSLMHIFPVTHITRYFIQNAGSISQYIHVAVPLVTADYFKFLRLWSLSVTKCSETASAFEMLLL